MLATSTAVGPPPRDPVRQLARWAARACPRGADVLNVGAGAGVTGSIGPLLARQPRIVGVDPDAALEDNPHCQERHRTTLEDFAAGHTECFDVVLSVFVLEHVSDPVGFARACAQVLRPGGSWFAVTPNLHHYFGAATWALSQVNAADPVLHWLKGDELAHEHHFPTMYRFNSRSAVHRHCAAAGFGSVAFQCYDAPQRYAWYLPAPLRWFPALYSRAVYSAGVAELMGHLSFQATKPAFPASRLSE
jgi:SAM-dependent methyltransferase